MRARGHRLVASGTRARPSGTPGDPGARGARGIASRVVSGIGGSKRRTCTVTSDDLGESVTFLYSQWLPQSGEGPRDFPLYFQRVRFFPDVPEHEAVTDIFLPLR